MIHIPELQWGRPSARAVRAADAPVLDIYRLARRLVVDSRHREPLKLGIALYGLFGGEWDPADLRTLARHDEFSLIAAIVIANNTGGQQQWLFQSFARGVRGSGRVPMIERLADATAPDVRNWLLRDRVRNDVMDRVRWVFRRCGGNLCVFLNSNSTEQGVRLRSSF